MATGNQAIFDAMIRRQINLQRMSKTEGRALLKLLAKSDRQIQEYVMRTGGQWSVRRLGAVRKEIARLREPAMASLRSSLTRTMTGTASQEMVHTKAILEQAVPVEFNFAAPSAAAVREAVTLTPFGDAKKMQSLGQWIEGLAQADQGRILGAIQAGLVNGATIPELTATVGQALGINRMQAEALARTSINHAASTARNAVFAEHADVLQSLMWSAILDGRTSPVCRAYDGQHKPATGDNFEGVPEPHLPGDVSPPAHIRCRSSLIPILDGEAYDKQLARIDKATTRSTATGKQQTKYFNQEARKDPRWSKASPAERRAIRKQVRNDWAYGKGGTYANPKPGARVGGVPADTTYGEWLRRQPRSFVNQVMGKKKADLFLDGGVRMDQFIDRFGKPLTLKQLADLY